MIDKKLFKLIGSNKKYIFITVLLNVISLISNILITASICYAIYLLTNNSSLIKYLYPLAGAILGIVIRYISTRLIGDVKDKLGRKIKYDLREKLYNKIIELGFADIAGIGNAGLTEVAIEGVEQLDLYFSSYIPQFFFAMLAPVILFLICVWINYKTALVLICCVPLIPISIVAVSKYAKKIFAKYWGKYISMGDTFLDSVLGLKELKIFDADAMQHKKINASAEEFRKITMKVLVMQLASTTIMDLVAYGGAGVGVAVTLLSVKNGSLMPIYGLFLSLVAVDFFLPLRAFGSAFHVAMNGASAGRKINSILNMPNPVWGNDKLDDLNIKLNNVYFSYDGKRDVLKNINMEFKNNSLTAIVGKSGCGKSTVVNMLIGALRPHDGNILVGDKPLYNLERKDWYEHLAVVSYNTYIFNESVRDNFKLAKNDVTDEEIYEALEMVNLKNFIVQNGGLEKVIAEGASNISGGERQRLALAIAIVAKKDIYVFDEATSNIDIDSEAIIMENIKKLSLSKNVIVISHRLQNVIDADNIYYMEDGVILESGSHKKLIENKKGYANLYNTQHELELGYMEVEHE